MKKPLYFLFIATLFILLSACSFNNVAYEEAMEAGLEELKNKDYAKAEKSFRLALDEKPDNEKAGNLLKQTVLIKQAESDINEGQFDAAVMSMTTLDETEDVSEYIAAHIEELKEQIKTLEATHKEFTTLYQKAKDDFLDEKHDDALNVLDTVLAQDFTHAYHAGIKSDIEKLQKEVTLSKGAATAKAEEERKETERIKAEEKRVAEEKKKEAEHIAAEKAAAALKAQKEEEAATSKGIGFLDGYWYNEDHNEACHFTLSFIDCAVPESDVLIEGDVTTIKRISDTELDISYVGEEFSYETVEYKTINFTVNYKQIKPDQIIVSWNPATPYTRITKSEANALFLGAYELR